MIDKPKTRKYLRAMRRNFGAPLVVVLLALVLALPGSGPLAAAVVEEANAGKAGETLDLKPLLVPGRVTVIDFYSPFCPPCRTLAPLMEQLAAKRADLAIKKVNINRPGFQGIDWRSPLAQQYSIRTVPFLAIFNPQGKLVAKGQAAMQQMEHWLKEAGLLSP